MQVGRQSAAFVNAAEWYVVAVVQRTARCSRCGLDTGFMLVVASCQAFIFVACGAAVRRCDHQLGTRVSSSLGLSRSLAHRWANGQPWIEAKITVKSAS